MAKRSLQSVLCSFFFFISFSAISVSAQVCLISTEKFKPNSSFDNNRRLILSNLASNVTAHGGYFNGSFGLGLDQVYAMGMCSSYADPDVCSYCIHTASESLVQTCLNQTDAYAWQGEDILCLVRYSSKLFSGVLVLEPKNVDTNYRDIKEEDQKEFDSVWDGLMSRMITRASSSLLSSSKYYAMDMDVTPFPAYGNISALMQCTHDITSNECKLCLQGNVDLYKSTQYHGKRGFIVLRPSCFFRWELFTFSGAYDGIHPVSSTSPPPQTPPSVASLPSKNKKDQPVSTSPPPQTPPSKTPSVASLPSKNKKDARFSGRIIALIGIVIFVFIILIAIGIAVFKRRKQRQEISSKKIAAATSNFSESNKLGEGGFGEVYKGMLMDGTEVAVKRLSKASGQGEIEFKNEVVVVAKLQHRNLVRLLGFSLQGEEKLLIYEYVPNKSLDYFLFDPNKRTELGWTMRRNIIGGITRGLLYLHQDSRLKIIHRDLKAGNILLDSNMNPKIADFGVARIFDIDQTVANTSRVVGTFGYMSPEYVTHGQISTKSDVYSFGVLVLEIISGKKTSSFYQMDGLVNNLVTYVWRLWENKSLPELIDPGIREDCKSDEFTRYIHIGLLCVQENPSVRPAMSTIHQWLTTSSIALPVPLAPGFFFTNGPGSIEPGQSSSKPFTCSVDKATITDVTPR